MAQTMATLNHVAKEVYRGTLNKQLNDDVVALRRIERSSDIETDQLGGKYVVFAIHTRRNSGIGARNEMEALPTPGQQGYSSGRLTLKYQYAGVLLSGQAISLINTKPQSFINAVETEMSRLRKDLGVYLNRQVYGDGSGTLATISATGSGNTLTVSDPSLLNIGDNIDILTSAGASVATGRTITGIAGNVITFNGATQATAAGQILTITGNYNREWTGFGAIVKDTGTLYNIDPTVEPIWKAVVAANGGTPRAISEGLLNQTTDQVKINGGKSTVGFTTYGVRRAYANLLQQQRQYVNTNGKFDGGYTTLAYSTPDGDIPLVVDRMAPKGKIWFMNEDELTLYRDNDWDFMTYGDSDKWRMLQQGGNDFDAYISRLYQYSELGTERRNTHAVVADIQEQ
ncbi:hypothetical protein [Cellulosimicrobium phage DS1]|nr:hypothetical protein [Cellulosimicrobium phage DS1]